MIAGPIQGTAVNRLIQSTLQSLFYPQLLTTTYPTAALKQVGTMALTALILEGSRHTDRWFLEKYYYLDTAMVPEIIYHEYSHIALSDQLALTHSTPVLEGLADYFATEISGNPKIADKIRKYSLSMPKNARNRSDYNPAFENAFFSNSDFVLSVLWLVRDEFPDLTETLVYESRKALNTDTADIRHDLIGSLLDTCSIVCKNPRADRMRLREIFEKKGF
jgi:hypothetical protein